MASAPPLAGLPSCGRLILMARAEPAISEGHASSVLPGIRFPLFRAVACHRDIVQIQVRFPPHIGRISGEIVSLQSTRTAS